MTSRAALTPCRRHGVATGPRESDILISPRPCPDLRDRLAGTGVRRLHRLEEGQDVLGAPGRPESEEPMVGARECPASTARALADNSHLEEIGVETRPLFP